MKWSVLGGGALAQKPLELVAVLAGTVRWARPRSQKELVTSECIVTWVALADSIFDNIRILSPIDGQACSESILYKIEQTAHSLSVENFYRGDSNDRPSERLEAKT
jgi:hypothetical protein